MNEAKKIKEKVNIADILSYYNLSTNRSGFIHCPFHGKDRTASLRIYLENNSWYCFSCNRGGDIINFVSSMEGLSFQDSCKKIDQVFGLHLFGEMTFSDFRREKREIRQRKIIAIEEQQKKEVEDINHQIFSSYRRWLRNQEPTRDIMADERFVDYIFDNWELYADTDAAAMCFALSSKHDRGNEWRDNNDIVARYL